MLIFVEKTYFNVALYTAVV